MKGRMIVAVLIAGLLVMTGCGEEGDEPASRRKKNKSDVVASESVEMSEESDEAEESEKTDGTETVESEEISEEDVAQEAGREEILIEDYSILDMILFAELMYDNDYTACELLDVNGDGCPELGIEKEWSDGGRNSQYIFNSWKNPSICVYSNISAAGVSKLYVQQEEQQFYLSSFYATADNSDSSYCRFSGNSWENIDVVEGELRPAENHYEEIVQLRTTDSLDKVQKDVEQYLTESERQYETGYADLNGDGTEELFICAQDYLKAWFQNVTQPENGMDESFRWDERYVNDDVVIVASVEDEVVDIQIMLQSQIELPVPTAAYRDANYLVKVVNFYMGLGTPEYDIAAPDYYDMTDFLYYYMLDRDEVYGNVASLKDFEEESAKCFGFVIPYEEIADLEVLGEKIEFPYSLSPGDNYPSPYLGCILDFQPLEDGNYLVRYNLIRYDIFSMDYELVPAAWSDEFAAALEGEYSSRLWNEGTECCILKWTGDGYCPQKKWRE